MSVREKFPDKKKAMNLIESAELDMNFTLTMEISKKSANTLVRNIYECFLMLGEAALVIKGMEPLDHVICIEELLKIEVESSRPLNLINNLRRLRHNVNYYGYRATKHDAEEAISIAKSCFYLLLKEIKRTIEK